MKRIIIDTDPGIDDAAAVFMALASPELSVEAITTVYGNGSVDACTKNAFRILYAANRLDIPVYKGTSKPLLREPNLGWAYHVHGKDALGNTDFPLPSVTFKNTASNYAAVEIARRVMAAPGEITLLALGRMTNIALALCLEPQLAEAANGVILMGGTVAVPGNVSQVATANLYEDPEAAAIVYSSGASLVQMGLDVCDRVELSQHQLDLIRQADIPTTRLLTAATPCIQAYYRGRGLLSDPNGVRYNDVPAVAYAIDPGMFRAEDLHVTLETDSQITRGQTVVDRRNITGYLPNASVCLEVDAERVTQSFVDRITGYRV